MFFLMKTLFCVEKQSTACCGKMWKNSTRFHVAYLKKIIKFANSNLIINKLKYLHQLSRFGMKLD